MHERLFHVKTPCPSGYRGGTSMYWGGGSEYHPSWVCRVDPQDPDKQAINWGNLRLYGSDTYVSPGVKVATPVYFKGSLRSAKACDLFLKHCEGCKAFFLSRGKWDGACLGCHNAIFCSAACHKRSWPTHQYDCRGVAKKSPVDRELAILHHKHAETASCSREGWCCPECATKHRANTAKLRVVEDLYEASCKTIHGLRHANALLIQRIEDLELFGSAKPHKNNKP